MQSLQKVSPPFEGGVAGTIDYLIFTKFISRPGWLISSFFYFYSYQKQKPLQEKRFQIFQIIYKEQGHFC